MAESRTAVPSDALATPSEDRENRSDAASSQAPGEPSPLELELDIYARILTNEARRRGIGVEVLDVESGYFRLTLGERRVTCRSSLSELTTAIAMSRCDDKRVTTRVLRAAGLRVGSQQSAEGAEANEAFLKKHERIVVKPARGEQGRGISVDVRTTEHLDQAIAAAKKECEDVVLEEFFEGSDLRIVVIDFQVVAAALRRPARVVGDGVNSVRDLIEAHSKSRMAATDGQSHVPMDSETERCVEMGGFSMDDVLPKDQFLTVRKTANLHTGGTIEDVTDQLHPALADAAVRAARAIEIPLTGLDLLVKSPDQPEYVIIEANERPGLANHEPRPTAERFIDLLFPSTKA